jgi:hypothetical protein
MSQNQVQNQPTAAYILSLIGGIFGLLGSIVLFSLGVLTYSAIDFYPYFYSYGPLGLGGGFLIGLGAWILVASILIIIFASKLKDNPLEHGKWGALILVFSIVGLGGGLLALIGGILALVYKPIVGAQQAQQTYAQQQYGPPPNAYVPTQQPTTRVCPQCGRIVQANERFCPNCGKQLY